MIIVGCVSVYVKEWMQALLIRLATAQHYCHNTTPANGKSLSTATVQCCPPRKALGTIFCSSLYVQMSSDESAAIAAPTLIVLAAAIVKRRSRFCNTFYSRLPRLYVCNGSWLVVGPTKILRILKTFENAVYLRQDERFLSFSEWSLLLCKGNKMWPQQHYGAWTTVAKS